jgi:protein CpxP
MSALPRRIALHAPVARSFAIAALIGASFLATPMTAARAAEAAPPAQQAGNDATATQSETVEQRITNLHSELKITGTEEAKWNNVAQAMRENAAAMEKLAAAKTTQAPSSMTAIDDLKGYEKFAQAHVDGLKNLISSFEALYREFPDDQKKVADEVFQTFGQKGRSHT